MSGNGPIQTGVPLADYQIGPRDTRPDLQVGQAFGRSVTPHEPTQYLVQLDTQSPTFKKARAFFHKTMAERQITKSESMPELQLKPPTVKPPAPPELKPEEVLAAQALVSSGPEISEKDHEKVDQRPTDFDQNPFLKNDNRKLKSTKPKETAKKRRLSLQEAAQKVQNMNQATRAFSGKNLQDSQIMMGFDRVANFKNQGIPPEYLEKMQSVADQEGVILAVRPVEKICRTLISEGYGSKGLHIKGKSSNWGPMAGFIPENQRFSKLAGQSDKIAAYNQKNHDAIHVKKNAPCEQLHISSARIAELEGMGILQNTQEISPAPGYSKAIQFEAAPKNGSPEIFEAHQREDGQWEIFSGSGDAREKLMVIPLTADFDLLFVHSHYEDVDLGQQDKKKAFHPELGIVSDKTTSVIDALNQKFDRGGSEKNMVHHGADTENPVTDMEANFPATIMIPEKMLKSMGIFDESPVLIRNEQELANLYKTMQGAGIRVETNPLWEQLKHVAQEAMEKKISQFGGRRKSI